MSKHPKIKLRPARELCKKSDWTEEDVALAKKMLAALVSERRALKSDVVTLKCSLRGKDSIIASAKALIELRNQQLSDMAKNWRRNNA